MLTSVTWTFLLDVVAGVSAFEAFETAFEEEVALRRILALEAEGGGGRHATGTRNENLTFLLRVEVDKILTGHEARLHADGTA